MIHVDKVFDVLAERQVLGRPHNFERGRDQFVPELVHVSDEQLCRIPAVRPKGYL